MAVLFAGRLAAALLPVARRTGVSPNAVTIASFAMTLAGAALLALGGDGGLVAALVLGGFVLDCLDGTLARDTGRTTDFGRWLDSLTDLAKVFALVAALVARVSREAVGSCAVLLGGVALLGYVLCEVHAQIARQLPQRPEAEYVALAAPWRGRLRLFGQRIDLAFAVGEVLATISLAAAAERPLLGLAFLAAATPIQFASYAIRFWRFRHVGTSSR